MNGALGVAGAEGSGPAGDASDVPQNWQNAAPSGTGAPHDGHDCDCTSSLLAHLYLYSTPSPARSGDASTGPGTAGGPMRRANPYRGAVGREP